MAPSRREGLRVLGAGLPWIVPVAAALWALLDSGTPGHDVGLYTAYLLAAVVLPGTLVFRALLGSRGNLPEDLGLGTATGLVVMLGGWALGAAFGLQAYLIAWPVLVVLPFVAVPRLWRHWRRGPGEPLPAGWSWAMSAVTLMLVLWATMMFQIPLPPTTVEYYPDLYYHLALVHEMTRSMPFQVPQLAGYTLKYHYLSDADIATASMVTGIAPTTVLLRLWVLPVATSGAVVFAALARTVSGRWWAGPVAAAVGFVGEALTLGATWGGFSDAAPVSVFSPSQTFAEPLIGLFALIAVDRLRGGALRWGWAFLPFLAVACAGAKASVLPPLAAGLGLTGLVALVRRRPPWAVAGLLGVALLGMAFGVKAFAGGGASVLEPQALAVVRWLPPYIQTLGSGDGVTAGGLIPYGVRSTTAMGRLFVAGLVVWAVLMHAPRLLGLVLPPRRREPRDPALPLIAGTLLAGLLATWLLFHPSASQLYFYTGVIPFGGVLTAWSLAGRVRGRRVPIVGGAAGVLCALFLPEVGEPVVPTVQAWAWSLAVPVLRAGALVLAGALILVLGWRRRGLRAIPVALLAATVGASVTTAVAGNADRVLRPPAGVVREEYAVSTSEMRAAFWLDDTAGRDDVVATNVHCVRNAIKVCNSRAFWVAGLGGRRTLVESWAYTDQAVAANGTGGLKYFFQPAPDPAVFDLNQRVFTKAAPADVARLRDGYHVRWLFADARAGTVSPKLAAVARLRYRSGPVTVYELSRESG
ncbi:hypothetical protein [Actinoplanes sp. NPDC051851]|uniref:hypothetical protein n=1 Tax=Actinoplanes sp. NPDC051851 TaxID=3154753 RepID=UPI003429E8D6